MVPFLSEEMGGILGWLMGFFIRKEVSKVVDTSTNVLNFKCHQHNWRMKYDVKLTTSGAEASKKSQIIYTKVWRILGTVCWKTWLRRFKSEARFLVYLCEFLLPLILLKWLYWSLKVNNLCLTKSLISCIVRNILQQNREIALRNNLMTFFKRLLNLTRLNLPILIKRLCVLINFLGFWRESKSLPRFLVCLQICVHLVLWTKRWWKWFQY